MAAIQSADFVVGAVHRGDLPKDDLPEVAFSGRSNVGKSSLINRLTRRKKLARTSSTPGKTQELNFYRIDGKLYLVDLPGYGYVKGGVELRKRLGRLTEKYLGERPQLRAVIQLVDARHGPTSLDMVMIEWLQERGLPFLLIFTKADKLSRSQINRQLRQLDGEGHLAGIDFTPFSAVNGTGQSDVLEWIGQQTGVKLT